MPTPLSRASLRRLDTLALQRFALPTIVLMENAARALALASLAYARRTNARGAVIVCGKGHNGGDGLAAARHLANARFPIAILIAANPDDFTGDSAVHLRVAQAMRLPIINAFGGTASGGTALQSRGFINLPQSPHCPPSTSLTRAESLIRTRAHPWLIIDALFGTGLTRPITGPVADLIAQMNAARDRSARVIAVDLPSGMDADTGRGWGPPNAPMVHAHLTVTMAAPKLAFALPGLKRFTGRVITADIGAPADLLLRR